MIWGDKFGVAASCICIGVLAWRSHESESHGRDLLNALLALSILSLLSFLLLTIRSLKTGGDDWDTKLYLASNAMSTLSYGAFGATSACALAVQSKAESCLWYGAADATFAALAISIARIVCYDNPGEQDETGRNTILKPETLLWLFLPLRMVSSWFRAMDISVDDGGLPLYYGSEGETPPTPLIVASVVDVLGVLCVAWLLLRRKDATSDFTYFAHSTLLIASTVSKIYLAEH